MAKDPAVLFYTSDFLSGTITMTNEEKGMYITLLCIQHQKGFLSEKDMLSVCRAYVEQVYCKFTKTDTGYHNERMKIEHEKRSNFCQSRRDSVLKGIENKKNNTKKSVRKAYVKRMEDENVNDNIVNNIKIKGKKIFFSESSIFAISDFSKQFPEWSKEKLKYYYDNLLTWSNEGNKKIDWIATARTWALRDEKEGKIKFEVKQMQSTAPDYKSFING